MWVSVAVVAICLDCIFQFKSLQLAQNIRVLLEIVAIGQAVAVAVRV